MHRKLLIELGIRQDDLSKDEVIRILHDEVRRLQMVEVYLGEELRERTLEFNAFSNGKSRSPEM